MKKAAHSVRARELAASPAVAGYRPAAVALAVAAAFMGMSDAFGQPAGAQAVAGQALLTQQGHSLVVTTQNAAGTNRSVINWQSFSIPAGSTTRFEQPTAQSLSINRVVGADPSAIYGTLSSNGRLVLVNPFGITVGAGAVVDTAGFTASTLKMSDADALAGRLRFTGDGTAGALSVNGSVISRGGDVVLIAPNVSTGSQAVIQSQGGNAILAAGQSVEITGRGLEGIVMQVQAPTDSAVNLGTLQGDAVGIFAGTLKHSGLIEANAVTTEGGKVVLKALDDNLVDGQISARAGAAGGSVDVLGNGVALFGGATINASGPAGGGLVRVGGDFHGANADVPNASSTYVGASASINADATQSGDGGKVVVWSGDGTRFYGKISARGGVSGGEGGYVEVSGKKYLDYAGLTDTRAPLGTGGKLLLDPEDITISSGADTETGTPGTTFVFGGGAGSNINNTTLSNQLANSDVEVITSSGSGGSGLITVNAPITWTSSKQLSLYADSSIAVNAAITGMSGTLGLRAAGGTITQSAPVSVSSLFAYADTGSVTLTNPSNAVAALSGYAPGGFSFNNSGDLSIGYVSTVAGLGHGVITDTGNLSITTTGTLSIDDTVYGVKSGTGSISLSAGQNINVNAGTSVKTQGGAVSLSAGEPYGPNDGALYVYGTIDTTGGGVAPAGAAITLKSAESDLGFNSVYMSGATVVGGSAGAVQVTGQTVEVQSTTITGQSVSIGATVSGAPVTINASTLSATGGGQVYVESDSGNVSITGSTLSTATGAIYVNAGQGTAPYSSGDAVTITDSTLDAGSGTIQVMGSTTASTAWGISLGGANTLSAAGGTSLFGDNQSTSVTYAGGGVYVAPQSTLAGTGALAMNGTAWSNYGDGVEIYLASVTRTGALTVSGNAPGSYGVDVYGSALSTAGGNVGISGAAGSHVWLSSSSIDTAGGSLTLSGPAGVSLYTTTLTTGGGNLGISGGGSSNSNKGVDIESGSHLDAGTGSVSIVGESSTQEGFFMTTSFPAGTILGGAVDVQGTTALGIGYPALWVEGETLIASSSLHLKAVNGDLRISAAPAVAPSPAHIQNTGSGDMLLEASNGNITIIGSNVQATGGGILTLKASGTVPPSPFVTPAPSPAPAAISVDSGSAISSGADLLLAADSVYLDGTASSGAARTSITPDSASRAISLGGTDEVNKLNLTQAELNNITAGTIQVGDSLAAGGLSIDSPIAITTAPVLSLIQAGTASITQAAAVPAPTPSPAGTIAVSALRVEAGSVMLTNAGNVWSGVSASSSGGSVMLANANTGTSSLDASAQGAVSYTGSGTVVVNGVASASSAIGSTIGSGAVNIRSSSISSGTGPVHITAGSGGSVVLDATGGDIGLLATPLNISGASAVYASAVAPGNVYLATPDPAFHVGKVSASGNLTIGGPTGPAALALDTVSIGGSLNTAHFVTTTLGAVATDVISAGGAMTFAGNVDLAGSLIPGGSGISTVTIGGNLAVLSGASLQFDLVNTTSYDQVIVGGATGAVSFAGSNSVVLDAAVQPPNGTYTLIRGTTNPSDPLPTPSGTVTNATLAFGSLLANVNVPAPSPAQSPLVDQITALLDGDHATAQEVVATLDTNPLTIFTDLVLQEEQKQAENGPPASDNVVANTCTK